MKRPNYAILPLLLILWIINKLGQLLTKLVVLIYSKITNANFSETVPSISLPSLKPIALPKIKLPKFTLFKNRPKKIKVQTKSMPAKPVVPIFSMHTLSISQIRRKKQYDRLSLLKPPRHKKTLMEKILPWPVKIGIMASLVLVLIFIYSFLLIDWAKQLPSPDHLTATDTPLTTEFYDRNGKLLYRLYEGKNRTLVKLDDLPPYLKQATIAIEDQHFYSHSGVDLSGIARSVKAYVEKKEVQGGSTITQQLIKNTLLTPERTFSRKIREVVLAFWAERVFSKDEILQMYFNEVPYGGTAWGITAASQTYFNKQPKDLDLAQASFLAGLPASPTVYSPYGSNPEFGKERQKQVLRRMVEDGYITQKQADSAFAEKLAIAKPVNSIKAPHFVMFLRDKLAQKYGERTVSQGGLRVYSSIDMDVQNMAEEIVADEVTKLASLDVGNGAAMVTDAKTGQILAMVGSKDYYSENGGNFNVTTALRQPGSSIKPITYATAFKQGYTPGTILLDTPTAFKNAWETYAPVNYDGKFHGPVTIRTALGSSYNIPAVKMLYIEGIQNMIQTAQDMGITTFNDPDRYGLSLTLGGGEVKMVDMMSVFQTFSQNGIRLEVQPIIKVVDADNIVLEDNSQPEGRRVLTSGVAYMISNILSDNAARTPAFGPNSLLNIPGHTVAVKTGTTDNKKDNWTFGYTPEFVVGVWVGNNDGRPMNPSLTSGVTGAAPIWNRIMSNLLADRPDLAFEKPAEVISANIDGSRDLTLSGQPSKSVVGLGKKKIKDENTQEEKESITFTDPFSTFSTDKLQQVIQPKP